MCRRRVFLLSSMSACDIIVTANVTLSLERGFIPTEGTFHGRGLELSQCIILLGSVVLKLAPVVPHYSSGHWSVLRRSQWTILPLARQADVSKRKVHNIPPCH
ncbi:uncharacterized protein F5891DRAFT_1048111 [Suillus fuscotomentosus]|uniref:Uncharacterized protein n=1 Tax=Suillus fuscotomentosus TaxID=1912939 RepID=A0AAD4HI94_9AGAM|nr:uncharacterized protein F5891DRAFT_1048111 [Suillus fuscotomentosus]KAG1897583.1 hypothetical protein F5891DRAFT_1048111 [Suillus fuscotomentosus]